MSQIICKCGKAINSTDDSSFINEQLGYMDDSDVESIADRFPEGSQICKACFINACIDLKIYLAGKGADLAIAEHIHAIHTWLSVPDGARLLRLANADECPVECYGCSDYCSVNEDHVESCTNCANWTELGKNGCELHKEAMKHWRYLINQLGGC